MTMFDDERQVDPLGHYWNEVVEGGPATPDDLDPSLATTVRRTQALGALPEPDPAFAVRLWEDLMSQSQTSPTQVTHPQLVPGGTIARDGQVSVPAFRSVLGRLRSPRRWWPVLETAAMLAVILALVGGVLVSDRGPGGFFGSGSDPAATPEAEREAEAVAYGDPFSEAAEVQLPSVGDESLAVMLRRLTFEPGSSLTLPANGVPHIFHPEAETLAAAWPDANAPGGWRIDSLYDTDLIGMGIDDGTQTRIFNVGDRPAVALLVLIGPDAEAGMDSPGVRVEDLGEGWVTPVRDRAILQLERRILASDEAVDVTMDQTATAVLVAEVGMVTVTHAERELTLQHDGNDGQLDTALLEGGDGVTVSLTNSGEEPASVVIATIWFEPEWQP